MTIEPTRKKKESVRSMQRQNRCSKVASDAVDGFRKDLLDWYDRHRRTLPWRAGPGERQEPYLVWLSEIMLQQTVVAAVIPYFGKFVEKWPTVHDLAAADQDEVMEAWAGLGYYSRARNLHKCAQIVSTEFKGVFPDNQESLKKLPGIGEYTSAAITAIAFDKPATVIDGNVDRVISRFFAIEEPLPASKLEIRAWARWLSEGRTDRPGDFAQAMMDLGATICTPKSPKCLLCPLMSCCKAYGEGLQQELPYKKSKAAKPQKYGYIYWVRCPGGGVLFERRPETGLLAGTLGLPTSKWLADRKCLDHLAFGKNVQMTEAKGLEVHHSFTHFDLKLFGYIIDLKEKKSVHLNGMWYNEKEIKNLGLPSLFKKFVNLIMHSEYGDLKGVKN